MRIAHPHQVLRGAPQHPMFAPTCNKGVFGAHHFLIIFRRGRRGTKRQHGAKWSEYKRERSPTPADRPHVLGLRAVPCRTAVTDTGQPWGLAARRAGQSISRRAAGQSAAYHDPQLRYDAHVLHGDASVGSPRWCRHSRRVFCFLQGGGGRRGRQQRVHTACAVAQKCPQNGGRRSTKVGTCAKQAPCEGS